MTHLTAHLLDLLLVDVVPQAHFHSQNEGGGTVGRRGGCCIASGVSAGWVQSESATHLVSCSDIRPPLVFSLLSRHRHLPHFQLYLTQLPKWKTERPCLPPTINKNLLRFLLISTFSIVVSGMENYFNAAIKFGLSIGGPLCFLAMQAAYIEDANHSILLHQSTHEKSGIPFLCLFANSYIWATYAFMKGLHAVLVPNISGCIAGLYCISIYQLFVEVTPTLNYCATSLLIFITVALTACNMLDIIGHLAMVMSVALMGSPLVEMKDVLLTRSSASMSLFTTLSTFCNALAWLLYGLIEARDSLIIIPNFIGIILAILQFILIVIYWDPAATAYYWPIQGDRGTKEYYDHENAGDCKDNTMHYSAIA